MAKSSPMVTVLLINWNGLNIIGNALDSLDSQNYKNFSVMVFDNASSDGSVEFIREKYPRVKVVKSRNNYGFAGGVNRATALIKTPYFALLNTDAIADPEWLSEMLVAIEKDINLAVVTPKSLLPDHKTIDAEGDAMSRWGVVYPRNRGIVDAREGKCEKVFSGSGGYSLYRRDVWTQLGGFDEDFFMYYEDIDYCYRTRLAGYDILYIPDAIVTHAIGISSAKRGKNFTRRYVMRNAQFVYWKNTPSKIVVRTLLRFIIANFYMLTASIKALAFKEIILAYGEVIVSMPQLIRKRRATQRYNRVEWRVVYDMMSRDWPYSRRRSKS